MYIVFTVVVLLVHIIKINRWMQRVIVLSVANILYNY